MKLATFKGKTTPRIGAVINGAAILDLATADEKLNGGRGGETLRSMQHLIDAGPYGLDLARELLEKAARQIEPQPLGSVTLAGS